MSASQLQNFRINREVLQSIEYPLEPAIFVRAKAIVYLYPRIKVGCVFVLIGLEILLVSEFGHAYFLNTMMGYCPFSPKKRGKVSSSQ